MAHPTSSAIFNYTTEEQETKDRDVSINVQLDSEKIAAHYNENKTTFVPNDAVFLRVTAIADIPYTVVSSAGTIQKINTNVPYEAEDMIVFAMESSAQLSYLPTGNVETKWLGRNPGVVPIINGTLVSVGQEIVAVLKCTYQTLGDRWRLVVTSGNMNGEPTISVVCVGIQEDAKASVTVEYSTEESTEEPQPIDLQVSDFCSDALLKEVDVFLDGVFKGQTNANGKLYLGFLKPGTTHALKMTKSGYKDSDLDVLHNDEFTVPTSS